MFSLNTLIATLALLGVTAQAFDVPSDCQELVDCLDEITGLPLEDTIFYSTDVVDLDNDALCEALLLAYGGQDGVTAMCNAAAAVSGGRRLAGKNTIPDAAADSSFKQSVEGKHDRSLQSCPSSFSPVYADLSGTKTSYDTLMLTVENTYLTDGKLVRSNADRYSDLIIGLATAKSADSASTACDNDFLEIVTLGGCLAAQVATDVTVSTLEVVKDQVDTHDALMDAAEIEATFKNSETILTQTCTLASQITALEEEVTDRFDTVDTSIADLRSYVETRFNTVDATLSDINAQLAMIRTLLITPQGQRTAYNSKTLICDGAEGGNCATVAAFP